MATTSEAITQQILDHHLTAFSNNDLVEILKDYTEASEVLTPDGPLKGLTAIKAFFAQLFVDIPTGAAFDMKQRLVMGSVAYIVWASESDVAKMPLGTDSFFLEGDKIRLHTVATYRLPK